MSACMNEKIDNTYNPKKRGKKRTSYFKKVFGTISEPHVNLIRAMISSNILSYVLE